MWTTPWMFCQDNAFQVRSGWAIDPSMSSSSLLGTAWAQPGSPRLRGRAGAQNCRGWSEDEMITGGLTQVPEP